MVPGHRAGAESAHKTCPEEGTPGQSEPVRDHHTELEMMRPSRSPSSRTSSRSGVAVSASRSVIVSSQRGAIELGHIAVRAMALCCRDTQQT